MMAAEDERLSGARLITIIEVRALLTRCGGVHCTVFAVSRSCQVPAARW
jgi:hypothetical protein